MLAQMTSTQLAEWEMMYQRWHMGDSPHERDDISAAIVAQTVAAVHMKRAPKLDTFLPTFRDPAPETPATEQPQGDPLRAWFLKRAKRKDA